MAKQQGVYKRGNIYHISYACNGRMVRRSTGQKSFRVALEMLQAVKTDIARGMFQLDRKIVPLFEEYAEYFIEYYSKPNKRSWGRDVTSMKHLLKALSGLRLCDITREHIVRYKADRTHETTNRGAAPKPATINRELALLKTMFNQATEEGKIQYNPVAGRNVMMRENNQVENVLSITEEARLYEVCIEHLPRRIYWILYTAFQTGMRRGELFNMKWEDVDFQNRTITIKAAVAKSGKARGIPINKPLTSMLKSIKNGGVNRGPYVFSGEKPLKDIKTSFNKAKRLAGIDPRFRFHDIRHTFASRLVTEHRVDLVTVQKVLGHASLKMLERYAHSRKEIAAKALETLGENAIEPELHNYCTIDNKKPIENELSSEPIENQVLTHVGQ